MAVRKRGKTWQIDYIDPAGKRIRRAFKLKKDAVDEHAKIISLIGEKRYLDVKKDCKTTFAELVQKYEENFKDQRSFRGWKYLCLRNFKLYFGEETLLSKIRYMDIETYRKYLRDKRTFKKTIRKDASVNRELSCLHHLFTKAVEWEMMEQSPFDRGKSLTVKENNERVRFLSEDEIPLFLESCSPHLRDIVVCALNTGMRRGEILSLRWDQIRNGFIYLQKTKTETPRHIPLNNDLSELFKDIRKTQKVGTDHVFTFSRKGKQIKRKHLALVNTMEGNPISTVQASFASALKRAGLLDFHFHDLRHTFASHYMMRGGSLSALQKILGHKKITMTMRYAHLSKEFAREEIQIMNGLTGKGKTVSQNVTKGVLEACQDSQVPIILEVSSPPFPRESQTSLRFNHASL